MTYHVDLSTRARRDLARIHRFIRAERAPLAQEWFKELGAAILSLSEIPHRCLPTPEDISHRHLLFGNKPHIYRIIFSIDERRKLVAIKTIRHGFRTL